MTTKKKRGTTARDGDESAASTKRGRPEVAIDEKIFGQLCQLQCTEVELAAFFGCTKRTIIRKLKDPKYRELFDLGKAKGRISLRRLQWRHAQQAGSAGVNMTIHLSKHWLKEYERTVAVSLEDLDAEIAKREAELAQL